MISHLVDFTQKIIDDLTYLGNKSRIRISNYFEEFFISII
jgi:hypothetical protein